MASSLSRTPSSSLATCSLAHAENFPLVSFVSFPSTLWLSRLLRPDTAGGSERRLRENEVERIWCARAQGRRSSRRKEKDREKRREAESQRMPKFGPRVAVPPPLPSPTERISIVRFPSRSGLRGPVRRRTGREARGARVRYESLCWEGGPHTRRLTAGWHSSLKKE